MPGPGHDRNQRRRVCRVAQRSGHSARLIARAVTPVAGDNGVGDTAADGEANHALRLAAPGAGDDGEDDGGAVSERLVAATLTSKISSGGNFSTAMLRLARRRPARYARAVSGANGVGASIASSRATSGAEKLVPASSVSQSPGRGATIASPGA